MDGNKLFTYIICIGTFVLSVIVYKGLTKK